MERLKLLNELVLNDGFQTRQTFKDNRGVLAMGIKRRQLCVDIRVQGTALARAVLHWLGFALVLVLGTMTWRVFTISQLSWSALRSDLATVATPVLVVLLLTFPWLVWDTLRVTNRFVGPVFRLKRALRQLNAGKAIEPIQFRDDDFWQELADEVNQLAVTLQQATDAKAGPLEHDVVQASVPAAATQPLVDTATAAVDSELVECVLEQCLVDDDIRI